MAAQPPQGTVERSSSAFPPGWAQPVLQWLQDHWTDVALVTALAVATATACALAATWRRLQSRRRAVLVPTSTFDPSQEEVRRWALALWGTRRNLAGLPTRRAEAVRLKLSLSPERQVTLTLDCTPRALQLVEAAVPHQVELRPEVDPDG